MAQFIRTMNFHSRNLGKTLTFVLTFDDEETPGIYRSIFPTAFRVSVFGETGHYVLTVTYVSQLGFSRAQIRSGVVQPASTFVPINVGQQTMLTNEGDPPGYSFSDPKDIVPRTELIKCLNNTNDKQNIGIGFFENPDAAPSHMLVFDGLRVTNWAQALFTPVLRGYITNEYQENEVLRGQIASPFIFNYDLAKLNPVTNWDLEYNPGTGLYTMTQRN